jgi:uncharacterized protein (TIGR03435 family)
LSGPAFGQSNPQPLSFEVADIQVSKSGNQPPTGDFKPGGRVDIKNVPFKMLVVEAYKLTDDRVTGGPGWIKSESFDIVAKAAPTSTEDDLRRMLQTLLAERFKLVIHHEEKVMPIYALLVGKKGTKLQPAADPNGKLQCKPGEGVKEQLHVVCQNMTMANLVDMLPRMAPGYIDAPVVDMTEIKGAYDIGFDWMGRGNYNKAMATSGNGADAGPLAVSMFDSVEKLGLKLESRKHPIDTIVIDSVERVPTVN